MVNENENIAESIDKVDNANGKEVEDIGPLTERQMYKLECITDSQLVAIDMLTPISISQSGKVAIDKDKPKKFVGKTHITAMGQLTSYSFPMNGVKNAKEAIERFDSLLDQALEKTKQKIEEHHRQMEKAQKSQIIVPPPGSIQT